MGLILAEESSCALVGRAAPALREQRHGPLFAEGGHHALVLLQQDEGRGGEGQWLQEEAGGQQGGVQGAAQWLQEEAEGVARRSSETSSWQGLYILAPSQNNKNMHL